MNDYDGLVLDSFGHVPTSSALKLMKQEGSPASRLFSAGEHVKAAERFTDWCAACVGSCVCWRMHVSHVGTSCCRRYDIDNDCVDEGGKEHSAIDHVLMSRDLNRAVAHVAFRHDFVPAAFCERTGRVTSNYSDHWPIFVEFDLRLMFEA